MERKKKGGKREEVREDKDIKGKRREEKKSGRREK